MDPTLARRVVREEEDLRYPLLASSLEPPVCEVTVADTAHARLVAGRPRRLGHDMKAGGLNGGFQVADSVLFG